MLEQVDTGYDANHRPVVATHSSGSINAVVQTSYDTLGRTDCVAQRMNPAAWTSLPASACTLQTAGTHGPDRIGRTIRNAAGETTEVQSAVGTALQAAERTSTYSPNGRLLTLTDGMGNLTSYAYDGHDPTAGTTNSTLNGLNQLTLHGTAAPPYDDRGNLAAEGGRTFVYSSENLLTGTVVGAWTMAFTYDPPRRRDSRPARRRPRRRLRRSDRRWSPRPQAWRWRG